MNLSPRFDFATVLLVFVDMFRSICSIRQVKKLSNNQHERANTNESVEHSSCLSDKYSCVVLVDVNIRPIDENENENENSETTRRTHIIRLMWQRETKPRFMFILVIVTVARSGQ
jgi:hypothetical protein